MKSNQLKLLIISMVFFCLFFVKKNIHVELKVTVETLKTELVERQELLIKAP